jgi:two-component system, NarL family, nitrate/nitrite response regulator NarL
MQDQWNATDSDRVRIFVIEDQGLYRAGLCLLLSQQSGFEIVGDAATGSDVLSRIREKRPDVALLAISSNDRAGIDILPEIFTASEETRVLVLSESNDPDLHRRAVRVGASGVISKDKTADLLIKAIERVNAGEAWLDRSTTASLLRELSPRNRAAKKDPEEIKMAALTEREREVIKLVGLGLKNKQIAGKLFISDITVHHHLTSIYSKLGVSDRLELLIYAYRFGLAELPC